MTGVQRIVIMAAVLAAPTAALAHHSYAMFDQTRKLTVQGTVKALEWTNPHVWVWVDVTNSNGSTETYGFETNAPSELTRFFGWTKRGLVPGDKVTVDYSPLKSGKNGGALRTLALSDGRLLLTPRSDPSGATREAPAPAVPAK